MHGRGPCNGEDGMKLPEGWEEVEVWCDGVRKFVYNRQVAVFHDKNDRPRWYWRELPGGQELHTVEFKNFPATCRSIEKRFAYAIVMARMGET